MVQVILNIWKRGIKFLKVDLYKFDVVKFIIEEDGIRMLINSLQGVGENVVKSIVEAKKKGEFISKEDLRIKAEISKPAIEALSNHECLNGLPETNQFSLFNL